MSSGMSGSGDEWSLTSVLAAPIEKPLASRVARDLHNLTVADGLVTIGTFSLLTGLSITTLRHYDDVGLLVPADVNPRTGYRRYRLHQAGRAHRVRHIEKGLEVISDKRIAREMAGTLESTSFAGLGDPHLGKVRDSYVQDGVVAPPGLKGLVPSFTPPLRHEPCLAQSSVTGRGIKLLTPAGNWFETR